MSKTNVESALIISDDCSPGNYEKCYLSADSIDNTEVGQLVRKYNIPYEVANCFIGESEIETKRLITMLSQSIDNYVKSKLGKKRNFSVILQGSHNPPFGYDVNADGLLVENAKEQSIIKLVVQLHATGWNKSLIARELENRELKTKKGKTKWHPGTIRDIVKRYGDR